MTRLFSLCLPALCTKTRKGFVKRYYKDKNDSIMKTINKSDSIIKIVISTIYHGNVIDICTNKWLMSYYHKLQTIQCSTAAENRSCWHISATSCKMALSIPASKIVHVKIHSAQDLRSLGRATYVTSNMALQPFTRNASQNTTDSKHQKHDCNIKWKTNWPKVVWSWWPCALQQQKAGGEWCSEWGDADNDNITKVSSLYSTPVPYFGFLKAGTCVRESNCTAIIAEIILISILTTMLVAWAMIVVLFLWPNCGLGTAP